MAVAAISPGPLGGLSERKPGDAILVVDDIVKSFETPDGAVLALDHVSLTVAPGEFVGVIGPSGCGKTTLINIIGGLLDGYQGTVRVAGEIIRGPHPSIGMIFGSAASVRAIETRWRIPPESSAG